LGSRRGECRRPDASPVLASSGDVTLRDFVCRLRLGVLARDRPAAPKQSAGVSTTDELAITTGPTGSFGSRSGASLEVCSPSAHVSRVALSEAAGHRTIPLRRCVARPRSDARAAVSRRRSPLRFFASGEVESASLDRADVRGGSCGSYSRRRVDAAAKRIVQTRVPSSSVRRASGIGETASHAHDGSSLSSAAATISLPGAGHAPTRPLARCSATRRRGTRGLARRDRSSL